MACNRRPVTRSTTGGLLLGLFVGFIVDRLGVDLRVSTGEFTDEYRVGFRNVANSAEDAKSEVSLL